MKGVLRRAARLVARVVPSALVCALARLLLYLVAQRPAQAALTDLFAIEDELTRRQNDAATRYDGGIHVKHRLTRYHDFFAERVHAGERVLDIGCGVGAVAASIAERSRASVVGIDLSRVSIADARARYGHPNLEFVHGDALVDLPSQAFDVVVLSNVLEHIDNRLDFLRSVQARFTPRRWLIRVPMIDRDWRVPLRQELGLFAFNDPTHYVEYTRALFEDELRQASLRLTHVQINWGEIWAEACAA